jgi:hypothetical protein
MKCFLDGDRRLLFCIPPPCRRAANLALETVEISWAISVNAETINKMSKSGIIIRLSKTID